MGDYAQDDEYWEYNADECTRLGIPFGTYLYSYATTEEQARLEGDHVARLLGLKAPRPRGPQGIIPPSPTSSACRSTTTSKTPTSPAFSRTKWPR